MRPQHQRVAPQRSTRAVIHMESNRKLPSMISRIILTFVKRYCMDQDGNDVLIQEQETGEEESEQNNHSHEGTEESQESESKEGTNCHFHAGVE